MLSKLPVELINIILSFEGSLRYRNGKWMNPLNSPKEIKDKITKCIKRKYNSIYPDRKIVVWSVDVHTHKRMSLFIRKGSYSHRDFTGPDDTIGDYRIINYKEGIIINGNETYKNMLIDDITLFNFIW